MKHCVAAILLVVVSIVIVVESNRKRMPQVRPPGSENEQAAGQVVKETTRSETDKTSVPASGGDTRSMPPEPHETAATHPPQQIRYASETHPQDGLLARAIQDLTPRVVSLITNQLARLGPEEEETYDVDDWSRLQYAKGAYVRGWGVALLRFAEKNGGMCPVSLDQAAEFYPQDCAWLLSVFEKDRFEIVYRGSLNDLRDPANVIVVRERVPTVVLRLAQHWQKAYIYGNGLSGSVAGFHSTDEFQAYESQHWANSVGE